MKLARLLAAGLAVLSSAAAFAGPPAANTASPGIPRQLDDEQANGYRQVFQALRASRWSDARLALDAMKPGPLHAVALAELYTMKGSPKAELEPLMALLGQAPELPEAPALARLATARGAGVLPALPPEQRMIWSDGAPNRQRARATRSDAAAAALARDMTPYIKDDLGTEAEALLNQRQGELSAEGRTEWQHRVGWIYFLQGKNEDARRLATQAQAGAGDWVGQADWLQGMAAWRMGDCKAAQIAFQSVAARAADVELRTAGLFWAARADMACGRPDLVQARLVNAAQHNETFYGLLARQTLGILDQPTARDGAVSTDWRALQSRPNLKVAAALVEIGENRLAEQVIRRQAAIGAPTEHPALARVAGRLGMPSTQLWLAHNLPRGVDCPVDARYPAPAWTPDGGWRVDKALVYAHALQESRFRNEVVSPAGAFGIMQVMPAAATDIARAKGVQIDRAALANPSTNIEVGQSYLEKLRDQPGTGGLLPKVIAAYNAGPAPVALWNSIVRDGGDPLLYIESIPFWETRGYVMTVLRNYWMYERQEGKTSTSRAALAQGMWPRFPGLKGPSSVRVKRGSNVAGTPLQTAAN